MADNAILTRKDRIIDLTIVSNSLKDKINNWGVAQEVYLNTDHSHISFNVGDSYIEEIVERLDFRKANWLDWETACSTAIEKWLETRNNDADINDDYNSFVSLIHDSANNIIRTTTNYRHSREWWNPELTRLSKEYKKAKRQFAKRADGANESKMKSALKNFKEEEIIQDITI